MKTSGLAVGAEWVPGRGYNSQNSSTEADISYNTSSSMSGTNLAASAWVPGGYQMQSSEISSTVESNTNAPEYGQQEESTESLVQVNWNGNMYYVPESMAYLMEGAAETSLYGPEELFDIVEGTLPAPAKKSLQNIGIPEV